MAKHAVQTRYSIVELRLIGDPHGEAAVQRYHELAISRIANADAVPHAQAQNRDVRCVYSTPRNSLRNGDLDVSNIAAHQAAIWLDGANACTAAQG